MYVPVYVIKQYHALRTIEPAHISSLTVTIFFSSYIIISHYSQFIAGSICYFYNLYNLQSKFVHIVKCSILTFKVNFPHHVMLGLLVWLDEMLSQIV